MIELRNPLLGQRLAPTDGPFDPARAAREIERCLERDDCRRLETWLDGRTAIIATHRVPILALTARTLILQNGRMAVDGPRDAVLAHLTKAKAGGPK